MQNLTFSVFSLTAQLTHCRHCQMGTAFSGVRPHLGLLNNARKALVRTADLWRSGG